MWMKEARVLRHVARREKCRWHDGRVHLVKKWLFNKFVGYKLI